VKDQGIGLLHVVSSFLQHALDYNTPGKAAGCGPGEPPAPRSRASEVARTSGAFEAHPGPCRGIAATSPPPATSAPPARVHKNISYRFTFPISQCHTGYDRQTTGQRRQVSL
jgi:hypothetical protein